MNWFSRGRAQNSGFSIIELMLFITVAGVLIVAGIRTYQVITKARPLKQTIANQKSVQAGLERFLATNRRLPCPADLTLPPDAVGAGLEQCGAVPPSGVYVGAVPYASLGIENKTSYDGWNRKLQYAVTAALTDVVTYNPLGGAITVTDHATGVSMTGAPGTGHIVLLSQGKSGYGAYTPQGKNPVPCGVSATGKDFENCNGDGIFSGGLVSLVPGPNRFESVLLPVFKVTVEEDKWVLAPGSSFTAASSVGRVGINTRMPREALDVNGTVSGEKVLADAFANDGGANAFQARIIGGSGVECPNSTMRGIKNNNEICLPYVSNVTVPGLTGACPRPGDYAVGTSSGGVILCNMIDGVCGASHGAASSYTPPVLSPPDLCIVRGGVPTPVISNSDNVTTATFDWFCQGINGGMNSTCQQLWKRDGQCGGLEACSVGAPSACSESPHCLAYAPSCCGSPVCSPCSVCVSWGTLHAWSCAGINGGIPASCSQITVP